VLDLAGADGLPAGERARLDHWFQSLGLGYGDRVFVDDGPGDSAGRYDVARSRPNMGCCSTKALRSPPATSLPAPLG
jgi:hypothetical protein